MATRELKLEIDEGLVAPPRRPVEAFEGGDGRTAEPPAISNFEFQIAGIT